MSLWDILRLSRLSELFLFFDFSLSFPGFAGRLSPLNVQKSNHIREKITKRLLSLTVFPLSLLKGNNIPILNIET
jgi:hypothetical protein